MNIQRTSPRIYDSKTRTNGNSKNPISIKSEVSFNGAIGTQYKKIMGPSITTMAKWFGMLAQSQAFEKIVTWANKKAIIKNNLFSHLFVVGSAVLSSFYIGKTLNNDKMDKDKRRTLAINQGATFIISTILGYTFELKTTNMVNNFIEKYKILNKGGINLEKQAKGIDIAKKLIIFDTMYRFIAPVLVTPLANHIGNKIQEKKNSTA